MRQTSEVSKMSIQLSPKKETQRQQELREFFNAEHGSKDLTPEQVKNILNCTPEDAMNEAIEMYVTEMADDMWSTFLANSSHIFEQYEKRVVKSHKDCKLIVNNEEIRYMKDVIRMMQNNGAKITYRPKPYIESMSACVEFIFNKSVSFENMELLSEMFRRSDVHICGVTKEENVIIKCEFFNIGKYVKEK